MAKRNSMKRLYADFCFRKAAEGKCPKQIRRELDEWARTHIARSTERGVRMFKPAWPWLATLQARTAD